jgi:mono/diheme cytochrome c family protein
MRALSAFLLALAAAAPAHAQGSSPGRGQLLYSTHCVECHTTRMHWRDQRLARDYETLKSQVRRFQGIARLDWSDEDIEAVARHLNDTIYRFPQSQASR